MNVRPRLLVLVAVLAVAINAGPVRAAAVITIHHAMNSLTSANWPDFVADREGFNARQGLNVETDLMPPDTIIAALVGGSIEIGMGNATQLALAVQKGANIVAVGVGADNQPYHLMSAPAVKTFADLRGKSLALASPGDVYTYATRDILQKHGLKLNTDVNVVYGAGQNQRFTALLNGAVQAGLFSPPSDADLAARGYNTLAFTPDYYPNLTLSANAVNRAWALSHADVLRRFLQARADAIGWLYDPANENAAIQLLMDETKVDRPAASAAYDYYIHTAKVFPRDGCIRQPGFDTLVRMLKQEGQLPEASTVTAAKMMDRAWCPK
jgi:ABC-type nitrate/sulfonate/bicarbonate transport system substrate-binding protein